MATRYSGELTVRITYRDEAEDYRCVISARGEGVRGRFLLGVYVGVPRLLEHAVDSSEAYDRVAHAALSFAAEGHGEVERLAGYHGDGTGLWHVTRKRPAAGGGG